MGGNGENDGVFTSAGLIADGSTGGLITLAGNSITLREANFDASGLYGGGTIMIGGGAHGSAWSDPITGQNLTNTAVTDISPDNVLNASATQAGNGGNIIVWSDQQTYFFGNASARGAGNGNGGYIETSGTSLQFGGTVDASSPGGQPGNVLLDPKNITIDTGTGTYGPNGSNYTPFTNPIVGNHSNSEFGQFLTTLQNSNTNIVVSDPNATVGGIGTAGAVYLFKSDGTLLATLNGTNNSDQVGNAGVTALTNGNFVVGSVNWDGGIGAATWVSGTGSVSGAVSSSNSLVGSVSGTSGDQVGTSVTALTNGNYVVGSVNWNGGRGAATWGSGTSGVTGTLSSSNSLVGSTANDAVGSVITALSNGNYVVGSPSWNNGTASVGAATWGSGTSGITGTISSSNSLVGSTAGDKVGTSITALLTNGNYVVGSSSWDNSTGAATWGSGTSGVTGTISSSNSLVGSTAGDEVGSVITALTNGNYVVGSQLWSNGTASVGAATWGSGTSGVTGAISSSNSLVGSTDGDEVGAVITALSNGNYVVGSPNWTNSVGNNVGAATWGSGTSGVTGTISSSNSLVGSDTGSGGGDKVGNIIVALKTNGNYVVASPNWDGGTGAATWGNGSSGTTGVISSSNSLIGGSFNDNVGASVTALTNGNYVVGSPSWDNSRGAATWGNGTSGATGTISHVLATASATSLIGSNSGDKVGTVITALTNGNYVVGSPSWKNGSVATAGAATWGDGTSGVTGTISSSNSLVGSNTGDQVGSVITALSNGNYVVGSPSWNSNRGAVTWGNGSSTATDRLTGTISADNSREGVNVGDDLGSSITPGNGDTFAVKTNNGWGNVYIFEENPYIYAANPSLSITVTPSILEAVLNKGNTITLQANTDLTLNSNADIIATPSSGNGGNLVLSAGRSVALNSNITTDNGNVTIKANDDDTSATGVVAADRDAGTASISMGSGTTINAGTGSVSMTIYSDGHGAAGDITLSNITAGSVTTQTPGNININSGSHLTASGSGNSIALEAGGNFVNNAGSSALSATSGRWLIYSANPADDTFGGLASGNRAVWDSTYSNYAPGSVSQTGNVYIFSFQPTVTFTPSSASKTYGDTVDLSSSYSVSGVQTNTYGGAILPDTNAIAFSGVPSVSSTGTPVTANAGIYNDITLSANTITALDGYQFALNNSTPGTLTVNTRPLTITSGNASFIYGDNPPTVTSFTAPSGSAGSGSGLVNGNSVSSVTDTVNASATTNAGTYTSGITPSSAVFGSGLASNYNITYANGTLTINTRPLTITSGNASFIYGDNPPTVTSFTAPSGSAGSGSGLVNGNSVSSVTDTVNASATTNAGTYTSGITPSSAVFGSGLAGNYNITYANGTLTINTRPVTITASDTSRVYGDSNPSVTSFTASTGSAGSGSGLVNGNSVSSVTGTYNATVTTNAGNTSTITPSSAVFGSGLASNYNITYANGTLTISTRPLTITSGNASFTYGDNPPTVTSFTAPSGSAGSGSGLVNGNSVSSVTDTVNASATTNAGTYTSGITPSSAVFGSGLAGNYNITYANGSLTVNARPLTITAGDASRNYGDPNPTVTAFTASTGTNGSGSGLVNSDFINSVINTINATLTTPAGTATITPSGVIFGHGLASNYAISYINGVLTIIALPVTTNTTTSGTITTAETTQSDVTKTVITNANPNTSSSTTPTQGGSMIAMSSSATGGTTGAGSASAAGCTGLITVRGTNTLGCVLSNNQQ